MFSAIDADHGRATDGRTTPNAGPSVGPETTERDDTVPLAERRGITEMKDRAMR